jgi:small conductance mechanosensitive channel
MNNGLSTLNQAEATLIDLAIRFGPKLLVGILILITGFVCGRWLARALHRSLARFELEPPVRLLLTRLVHLLVVGLFLILALENLGVQLLPLVAGLGVAGAGVALAMQGVLGNAVAGLNIIFSKPYRVGEYVAIVGVEGQVDTITLFSTTLIHADRSRVIVPNRKIVGEILHNHGQLRQTEVHVNLPYDADLQPALMAIRELVSANARVLADPPSIIGVSALAESAVRIVVKPWVRAENFGVVESELYLAIMEKLRARGIAIPYPLQEVRLLASAAAQLAPMEVLHEAHRR